MDSARQKVTRLLGSADRTEVWAELLPLVYDELRALAKARMRRERAAHTLDATALVHEAWLKLAGDERLGWQSRRHFFGAAASAMQRVLADHARRALATKRGGAHERVSISLGESLVGDDPRAVLEVGDALDRLEREDARAAEVARLRLYAGLEIADIASALELSERTAAREWAYARARLATLLGGDAEEKP